MKASIVVVSLGPGDPDLLNAKTLQALRGTGTLILRTGRHPVSSWLAETGIVFSTLDALYDASEDFDGLNRAAADALIRAAASGPVVYGVPDALTDQTVRELLKNAPAGLSVSVIPGVSLYDAFLSSSLSSLSFSPLVTACARELAEGFTYDPNLSLLVTELNDGIMAGQVKLFLSDVLGDEKTVFLLRTDEAPLSLPLYKLDRADGIDHRSAVLVPACPSDSRDRFTFSDLLSLADRFCSVSGASRTHESLVSSLPDAARKTAESVEKGDPDLLCDALSSLLFQVVSQASAARAFDEFSVGDVITLTCRRFMNDGKSL